MEVRLPEKDCQGDERGSGLDAQGMTITAKDSKLIVYPPKIHQKPDWYRKDKPDRAKEDRRIKEMRKKA